MKKNINRYFLLLSIVLISSISSLQAQKFNKNKRYWSFGGSLNAMNYVGDMDPGTFFISPALAFTRWNFGACAIYRYSPRVSFRGALAYGRIEGNDRKSQKPDISTQNASGWRYIRGSNFVNDLFEVKVDAIFDLFENRGKYNKRVNWTPYGFIGIAYFFMNPQADYGSGIKSVKDVMSTAQPISSHQIAIPFGFGARFKVSKQLDLAVELGLRKTFTGNLDGINGAYLDPLTLSTEQKLFDNPSMIGYGKDAEVTKVINQQGILIYDNTGLRIALPGGVNSTENQLTALNLSSLQGTPYITPYGFGWKDEKKAEYQSDWYIVLGVHLTYIIPERVQCPKFR